MRRSWFDCGRRGVFLARQWARITAPVLGAVVAGFMIAAPWIPSLFPDPRVSMAGSNTFPTPAVHRIPIWQTTAERIHDRPWLGHGFDTARSLYPQSTTMVVPLAKPTMGRSDGVQREPIPLHPHNMIPANLAGTGRGRRALAALAALLSVFVGAGPRAAGNRRAAGYGFLVTARWRSPRSPMARGRRGGFRPWAWARHPWSRRFARRPKRLSPGADVAAGAWVPAFRRPWPASAGCGCPCRGAWRTDCPCPNPSAD